ncbi:MAG: DUF1217 domain-containing protein [Pseudomonadota bacterium]
MSFQPVVPLTGYTGWRFLDRTLDNQQAAFNQSQPIARATDYFRANIGNVQTAADLVNDRQLLSVALGAFGLDEDINNRFFIQQILEGGTIDDDALANRLADNRYADFSRAFGFGDRTLPRTQLSAFPDEIINRYTDQQFARAVGEQNNDLRLALNVGDGITDIVDRASTNTGQWFSIMGNAPLREVFQTALGLPRSIASVDLDQQREIFEDRARSVLGTDQVADLTDPAQQERLIQLFLVRAEAAQISANSGPNVALTLLQAIPR